MARFMRGYGRSKLGQPVVTGPAVVFRPVQVRLAQRVQQRVFSRSRLGKPLTQQTFVAAAVRVELARNQRIPRSRSRLSAPVIPAFIASAIRVEFARRGRAPKTRSRLAPPVTPTSAFLASAVKVKLTSRRGPSMVAYKLLSPVVISSPNIFRPVDVHLVRRPQQTVRVSSRLRPPSVVSAAAAALARPVAVFLTRSRRQPRTLARVRPPLFVTVAALARPIATLLVRTPRRPAVTYGLRNPTVIQAAVAVVFRPVQVFLTQTRKPRLVRARVNPPRVLSAAFIARAVATRITRTPKRPFKSRLGLPAVVSPFILFLDGFFRNSPQGRTGSSPDGRAGCSPADGEFASDPDGKIRGNPQEGSFD